MLDVQEQLLDSARAKLGSRDCQRRLVVQQPVRPIQKRARLLFVAPQLLRQSYDAGKAFGPLALVGRQPLPTLEGCRRDHSVHEGVHRCRRLDDAPGDRLQRPLRQALLDEPLEVAPRTNVPSQHRAAAEDLCDMFGGAHESRVSREPHD